jgi:hypothetical protein
MVRHVVIQLSLYLFLAFCVLWSFSWIGVAWWAAVEYEPGDLPDRFWRWSAASIFGGLWAWMRVHDALVVARHEAGS